MTVHRTAYQRAFRRINEYNEAMQDPVKRRELYRNSSGPDGLADWEHRDKEAGEDFADVFDKFVNVMGEDRQAYAIKKMTRCHRTLQQSFTRFMVAWFEELATMGESAGTTDLRNEATMRLAKSFVENVPVEDRALPTV